MVNIFHGLNLDLSALQLPDKMSPILSAPFHRHQIPRRHRPVVGEGGLAGVLGGGDFLVGESSLDDVRHNICEDDTGVEAESDSTGNSTPAAF